ncbi:hypothetical protein [Vibrio renipiscarius]|uniref:Uncharacterized protein n=1 Tax=Vibrio renipiscarius TaxID=1461322 RepID=A0A0C2K157_9VIBR|nr:hypothetical protein [Vibrio renipiscarius]KII75638.1 hypothetical protein PL18_18140 [Vibrio renipiscarius]KII81912.1 hypothetical protein OJ16_01595 [Vibrio renipiscarius]
MLNHTPIDIPFNFRHTCWFCGEPSSKSLHFPRQASKTSQHTALTLPACRECDAIKYPSKVNSIWVLRAYLKQALITKYTKHLAIGENWTEQELLESGFSGALLGGFGDSAWQMYEIAKQRIAFEGWPLSIDDLPFYTIDDTSGFEYNETRFSSLSTCIDFFVAATGVDHDLLTQLIDIVTPNRFDYALKIAKLNKRVSPTRRNQIIEEITAQEDEKREAEFERLAQSTINDAIIDVEVSGTIAPAFAIQWAMERGAKSLFELCPLEDEYFDDFEHLGGAAAFASYNGLQLYLKAREDQAWIDANDPNKDLWRE